MDAAVDIFRVALPTNGNATHPERIFLQGSHTRTHELRQIIRVAWEMLRGFRVLHFVGPCVTVFGSSDLNLLLLTDSIDEAMAHVRTHAIEKFGLHAGKAPRRRWWLFEKPQFVRAITDGGSS